MIQIRKLNETGMREFEQWLEGPRLGPSPFAIQDDTYSETAYTNAIDPTRHFQTRFELGEYLVEQLSGLDFEELLEKHNDGLWSWIAIVYLDQLIRGKRRRSEYYVVKRRGSRGSLAYRHLVRTSFEIVSVHGEAGRLCTNVTLNTWGEMSEQLASRQSLVRNREFFRLASGLYLADNGRLRRGAAAKPKNMNKRKPGDRTGEGSARRLAITLQRFDLLFDTEIMQAPEIRSLLPREFRKWTDKRPAKTAR